jgi:hypothetical protein
MDPGSGLELGLSVKVGRLPALSVKQDPNPELLIRLKVCFEKRKSPCFGIERQREETYDSKILERRGGL